MDGESTTAQGNKGGTESKTAEERIAWTEKDVKYIIRLKEASKAEIKRIRVSRTVLYNFSGHSMV